MCTKLVIFILVLCGAVRTEYLGYYGDVNSYENAYAPSYHNYKPKDYSFEYGVSDPHTGDHKTQWEKRENGVVRGAYSLLEPDGTTRIVEYVADDDGFRAVVKKIGESLHPAPIVHAEPVDHSVGLYDGYSGAYGGQKENYLQNYHPQQLVVVNNNEEKYDGGYEDDGSYEDGGSYENDGSYEDTGSIEDSNEDGSYENNYYPHDYQLDGAVNSHEDYSGSSESSEASHEGANHYVLPEVNYAAVKQPEVNYIALKQPEVNYVVAKQPEIQYVQHAEQPLNYYVQQAEPQYVHAQPEYLQQQVQYQPQIAYGNLGHENVGQYKEFIHPNSFSYSNLEKPAFAPIPYKYPTDYRQVAQPHQEYSYSH